MHRNQGTVFLLAAFLLSTTPSLADVVLLGGYQLVYASGNVFIICDRDANPDGPCGPDINEYGLADASISFGIYALTPFSTTKLQNVDLAAQNTAIGKDSATVSVEAHATQTFEVTPASFSADLLTEASINSFVHVFANGTVRVSNWLKIDFDLSTEMTLLVTELVSSKGTGWGIFPRTGIEVDGAYVSCDPYPCDGFAIPLAPGSHDLFYMADLNTSEYFPPEDATAIFSVRLVPDPRWEAIVLALLATICYVIVRSRRARVEAGT